jgi:hypothetical protein
LAELPGNDTEHAFDCQPTRRRVDCHRREARAINEVGVRLDFDVDNGGCSVDDLWTRPILGP